MVDGWEVGGWWGLLNSNANASKKVLADDRRNPRSTEQWSYFATCSSIRIRFYKLR